MDHGVAYLQCAVCTPRYATENSETTSVYRFVDAECAA